MNKWAEFWVVFCTVGYSEEYLYNGFKVRAKRHKVTKRKDVFFWILGMVWWGAVHAQSQAVQPLRLSVMPLGAAEAMVREFEPLAASLARLGGRPVEFVYLDRHEKVLDALREGRIELAVLGALPYAELVGLGPGQLSPGTIQPLVRFKEADGQGTYRCVLVAFPDDRVVLSRAQGLTLGMSNPLSTCGPLSARNLLAAVGVDWARMQLHYLGHLTDVARAVVAGRVRLGAVNEAVARQHASLGLQVLASTEPLPGLVLVAHAQRVGANTLARLARLADTPTTEYSQWGASIHHGLLPVTDADYAPVRELMKVQRP